MIGYVLAYALAVWLLAYHYDTPIIPSPLMISVAQQGLFLLLRLLFLCFLVLLALVIFLRKDAVLAIMGITLLIILIFIVDFSLPQVALALWAETSSLLYGIMVWTVLNSVLLIYIRKRIRYELV